MADNKEIVGGMTINQVLEGLPEFEPIAYYDKHLDAIRVQIVDCSIWEERLDGIMTIYHANHHPYPDGLNDVVGFVIKGVRHLLKDIETELHDIEVDWKHGPIRLAEFLDGIFKLYPSKSTRFAVEFYRNLHIQKIESVEIELLDAA